MKRKTLILSTATAVVLGLGALGATITMAQGPFGPGGCGHGYGQGGAMMGGYPMMRGKGCCNYGQMQTLDKPLTTDDVRANLEQKLKWRGNDRLKVGTVADKDDKTIIAEIVTVDDSLVRKVEIDKATGRHTPVK